MDIEEEFVTNVYNRIAPDFKKRRPFLWDWIKSFLYDIPRGSSLMDIGCGGGRVGQECLSMSIEYTGVDSSQSFIDICTEDGLSAFKCDMCNLPFQDNSQDYITSIASFHHIASYERRIAALKEMKRVLRPKGKILLSVWSINQPEKTRRTFTKYGDTMVPWNRPGLETMRYYYIFKLIEIRGLINECGLAVERYNWECGNEVFILSQDFM